jgi:uncharacterized protein
MVMKINGLKDGVHEFIFENKIEELELSEPFFGKYLANITIAKSHSQILLDAELLVNASFECDRCGTQFKSKLENKFRMVYLFGEAPVEEEFENTVYIPFETDKINLYTELRDYMVLSVPMKKLCKPDCKGLCYHCGKNLNEGSCNCNQAETDPRWQPLVEIKKKMNLN